MYMHKYTRYNYRVEGRQREKERQEIEREVGDRKTR